VRDAEGETYLDLEEVTKKYKWGSSTLYLFRSQGLLESYKFRGDKKSYWKLTELEAVYHRPPEVTKRGPKSHALRQPISKRIRRARQVVGAGA
jgi:hypothetical protein